MNRTGNAAGEKGNKKMKHNRWLRLYEVFVRFSIYPLLVLVGGMGVLACGLMVLLVFRVAGTVELPAVTSAQHPKTLPTPRPRQLKILPNPVPTATDTPTPLASPTFTPPPAQLPTSVVVAAVNPAPGAIPVVYPTVGGMPTVIPTTGAIPIIYPTPGSPPLPTIALVSEAEISPVATPLPTATPMPEYDYMLAEFFNSPTTNNFLLIYVAIVDSKEIPIGDMKLVGVRQDQNLTYESPLSTWFYEGYNAPGEVIKSGNVKFEPPGGIESTSWVLHLEDSHGNRQSDDVSFDVDINDKQWYFVKFRRKY
ncbi:MAG: hypothetical protein FOGNACKC_03488 [Anaerolineae bacterium]|nr:hypothetical protein [Anaerolineae bacterium]